MTIAAAKEGWFVLETVDPKNLGELLATNNDIKHDSYPIELWKETKSFITMANLTPIYRKEGELILYVEQAKNNFGHSSRTYKHISQMDDSEIMMFNVKTS
jgi:hypothetical protein